jgi:hypothetical protein
MKEKKWKKIEKKTEKPNEWKACWKWEGDETLQILNIWKLDEIIFNTHELAWRYNTTPCKRGLGKSGTGRGYL